MRIGAETRVVVTGASAGLGRALAIAAAARGARVGLVARRRELLEALVGELAPSPAGDHVALAADVVDRAAIEAAIDDFCERAGGIDVLFANAGVAHYGPFAEVDLELAERMIEVNVLGTTYTVAAAVRPMLERGAGQIVVTSSGAGLRAFPSAAVYGGTKAYDRGFAEALRHELAGTGVSVTTVFPGEVATDLHAHPDHVEPEWRREGEALAPEQVAQRMLAAVEADERNVYVPGIVRLLGVNGVSPKLADRLLGRIRGPSAAPRRD